ncbi:MAG: galactokinase [Planctomycetota bacterium]
MVNADSLIAEFRRRFTGCEPSVLARAPGRVNLIGEHVDYNGGLVMPFAIHLATWAVVGRREDQRVIAHSIQSRDVVELDSRRIGEPLKGWGAYVQGVITELQKQGMPYCGMNILIDSDVPAGAGLSSSAALESVVALAGLEIAGHSLSLKQIADACRNAEHKYARVPCGIMDQMASLFSRAEHIMLLDCRDETVDFVHWPSVDVALVIVDSRSPHELSSGTYALRVEECRNAQRHLTTNDEVPADFRTVSLSRLEKFACQMSDEITRRARHVITEIARVRLAADALRQGDFQLLGSLMDSSHQSLAVDYEVSTPQMDALASIIQSVDGVYGARLTGAGFGGCVVAVADRAAVPRIEAAVRREYDPIYGVIAPVWTCRPSDGASVTRLERRMP